MPTFPVLPTSMADALPLSVVVPTHGRSDLYLQTLESLERQTFDGFEVIVTDDSPNAGDRTVIEEALEAYATRTNRQARYVFSVPRLGQARNTNQGLQCARGRFVRILHSDDLLAPHALEAEVALLSDPRLDLGMLSHYAEAFTDLPKFNQVPTLSLIQPSLFFRSRLHSGTPLPSALVFPREVLERIGGMREDMSFLCDWEFVVRIVIDQHRHNRFIGQLTPGFVGWRVHKNSTTGQLWDRHFIEHELLMRELRADVETAEALIGDRGTRDGFFATAVRYRYRRLFDDIAHMTPGQALRGLPRIARCVFSRSSLRDRLTPAPWTPRGSRNYPNLVVPCEVPPIHVAPAAPAPAPTAPPVQIANFVEPRKGVRFVATAYASAAIIRWGKGWAARYAPAPRLPRIDGLDGPGPVEIGDAVEIFHSMATPPPAIGTVAILTEYNNTTNFWGVRRLLAGASCLKIRELNANQFVEPVLHQCLKYLTVGTQVEVPIYDNQHLTTFGFKALLDRLCPDEFEWAGQASAGPHHQSMRYRRRVPAHATYIAPHTGWTFGMLTTGQRLANVERFIDSIEQNVREPYEILIVSPVSIGALEYRRGVRVLPFDEHDELGWITRKKNLICAAAKYSDILICHDRFWLAPDFARAFADWGFAYGLAALRVRLPDGRRGVDWAVVSSQNQVWSNGGLLDYRAYSQYAYNPGGATVLRKAFWRDFPWNENLFWNEHEDVELCRRIQRQGGIIALTAATVIAAEDRWVDANPRIPYCDQNEVLFGRPVGEQRILFLPRSAA